jgi:hypothetical protein
MMMSQFEVVDNPCGCGICNVCHIWLASHRPENRVREWMDEWKPTRESTAEETPTENPEHAKFETEVNWRVISLRGRWPNKIAPGEFVYVGRAWAGLEAHPLANPFSGPSAVERYSKWLNHHPDRQELLRQLHADTEGGRIPIACWCGDWEPGQPAIQCHAHTLAQILLDGDQ